ncbi:MAG TPA: geranylgeranyl reductase family protein [Candidatus Acidoferrum sp.]|nr:geranylgeranyl reductase family protein [Candidatus Acidoferrum sp.]
MIDVAIVGGGPAGSYCAYCLAKEGVYPVIFDHSHPREKPCGGLIMPFAQKLLPFLEKLPIGRGEKTKLHLISPSGRETCLSMRKGRMLCFSRMKLDQSLVDMATGRGASIVNEQVTAIEREGPSWKLRSGNKSYNVKIVIGADGVNSLIRRRLVGPLGQADLGICCGYFVKKLEKEDITFKFLANRKGYIWLIPRDEETSLGIGSFEMSSSIGMRQELNRFVSQAYPQAEICSRWAALIPNIKSLNIFKIPVAGPDWVLIGDAAGHVNSTLGEGLMYALLDGELAAKAIVRGDLRIFDHLWREAYGSSLFLGVKLRKLIYTKPGLELYCKFLKLENDLYP